MDEVSAADIGYAIELAQHGERERAFHLLGQLWTALGSDGNALTRCAIAHHLADTQDDPREELAWDRRALQGAESVGDRAAGLFASLHLNLGRTTARWGTCRPHGDTSSSA